MARYSYEVQSFVRCKCFQRALEHGPPSSDTKVMLPGCFYAWLNNRSTTGSLTVASYFARVGLKHLQIIHQFMLMITVPTILPTLSCLINAPMVE